MTLYVSEPFVAIQTAGETYVAVDAGEDTTYLLSPSLIGAGSTIRIIDGEGNNTIQLADGLEITSSTIADDEAVLELSNGTQVNIRGASFFTYDVGGNDAADVVGVEKSYADFVADDLGTTVPAAGEAPSTGGAATIGTPIVNPGDITLTESANTVSEGETVTYTLELPEAATEDTVVEFTLVPGDGTAVNQGTANTNTNDFGAGSFNTVTQTIAAGDTTATFSVSPLDDNLTELQEGFTVTAVVNGVTYTEDGTVLDGTATGGQTFTLTPSTDTPTGTGGDDLFVGTETNLSSADILRGGDGNDTFRYASSDTTVPAVAVNEAGFVTEGIETIEVTADNTAGTTFDVTGVTGMTSLVNNNSSQNLTLTGLGALTNLTLQNVTGGNTNVQYKNSVLAGTADAQTLILNGVADNTGEPVSTISIGNSSAPAGTQGLETLDIMTTGAASKLTDIITGATTINVTGDQNLMVTENLEGATTINAGTFTGNLGVFVDSGAKDVVVTGGTGDDTADFRNGWDTGDSFDGKDGIDTVGVTNAVATGTPQGTLANVEQLNITTAGTGTIDMDNFSGITKVIYDTGLTNGAVAMVDDAVTGVTVEVDATNTATADLTVDLKTDGTADEVNIVFDQIAAGDQIDDLTVDDAETLNISVDDDTNDGTGTMTIADLNLGDTTTLNIDGDADLTITGSTDPATPVLASINASAFGTTTRAKGDGMTGNLMISGTDLAAGGATVVLGSGNDTFNVANATGADTFTLGDGKDTLTYTAVAQSDKDMDIVTDFTSGTDVINLQGLGILSSTQFDGNRATFAQAQGALASNAGTPTAVFQQDEGILWVDITGDGTLDNTDFRVQLQNVTSITTADLGFGVGVTFTANQVGFNTATAAHSNENNAVTNEDDTINATVAQINDAATTVDGLLGADTLNITGAGVANLTTGTFAGNTETITLGSGVTGLTTTAADINLLTTLTGSSATAQTLNMNDTDNLTGIMITNVETLVYNSGAGVNITIDESNLASFSTAITGGGGADDLILDSKGNGVFNFSTTALTAVEDFNLGADNVAVTVDAADLADVTDLTVTGASNQTLTLNDTDDLSGITFSDVIDGFSFGDFAVTLDANNITNMAAITGGGGAAAEVILNDDAAEDFSAINMTNVSILDASALGNKALTLDAANIRDIVSIQGDNADSNDLVIADIGDATGTTVVDGFDTLQLNGTGALTVDHTFFNLGTGDFINIDGDGGANEILNINVTAAGTYDFGAITVGNTNTLQAINITGSAGSDIIEMWAANGKAAAAGTPTTVATGTGNDQIRFNEGSGNDTPGSGNASLTVANAVSVTDYDAANDSIAFSNGFLTNAVVTSSGTGTVTAATDGFVYINDATVNDFSNLAQFAAAVGNLSAAAAGQSLAFAIANNAGNQVGIYAFTDSDNDADVGDEADNVTLVGIVNVTNGTFDLTDINVF